MESRQRVETLRRIALHQRGQGAVALGHVGSVLKLLERQIDGRRAAPGAQVTQAQTAQRPLAGVGRVIAVLTLHLQIEIATQEVGLHGVADFAHQVDQRGPQRRRVGRLHAFEQIGFGR